ncbi:hypothetical protein SprV_0802501500 [Sparganum proliferum]
MAAERFPALRPTCDQSVDDFANEQSSLTLLTLIYLFTPNRDSLILHRFTIGLRDPNVTDILLLHPPANLTAKILQCPLRELLTTIVFLRQFKNFLVGRRFVLRKNHRVLQWLGFINDPTDQLARWQEFLQDFDFEGQFRAGHNHGSADAFSRLSSTISSEDEVRYADINTVIASESTPSACSSAQDPDPDAAVICQHLTQGLSKPDEQEVRGTSHNAGLLLNQWPYLVVLHTLPATPHPIICVHWCQAV